MSWGGWGLGWSALLALNCQAVAAVGPFCASRLSGRVPAVVACRPAAACRGIQGLRLLPLHPPAAETMCWRTRQLLPPLPSCMQPACSTTCQRCGALPSSSQCRVSCAAAVCCRAPQAPALQTTVLLACQKPWRSVPAAQDADIVTLEFSVNEKPDAPYPSPERRAFEQLLRRLLRLPGR